MKAIILAAGVGSRLGRPLPKPLATLPTGETILGRQIRIFREVGIREIIVVVGFKKTLGKRSQGGFNYAADLIHSKSGS